jgi:hypothetical protein
VARSRLVLVRYFSVFTVGYLTEEDGIFSLGIKIFRLNLVCLFVFAGAREVSRNINIFGFIDGVK